MHWYNSTLVREVFYHVCTLCSKKFTKADHPRRHAKYCSHKCFTDSRRGIHHSAEHSLKIAKALSGKPKTREHAEKVAARRRGTVLLSIRNEKHHAWKGDLVGYCSLHDWVHKRYNKPQNCEKCGVVNYLIDTKRGKQSYLQLANISGEYRRDVNDWKMLCPKCHSTLDKGRNSISKNFIRLKRITM